MIPIPPPMIVRIQFTKVIIVAFVLFIGAWITDTPAGETFYDAGGRRIGEVKQSRGRKNYYGPEGKLLGWSKFSGGKYIEGPRVKPGLLTGSTIPATGITIF